MEKKYWKGVEELRNDAEFVKSKQNEFAEGLPIEALGVKTSSDSGTNRRDFLKYLGFGVAAATLVSCEAPIKRTIPYLVKPEEITPGNANWYASSMFDGHDYASVLVKTREGRPIKIEGNPLSKITNGGTDARAQASVLGLYDSGRIKTPMASKTATNWTVVDKNIKAELADVVAKNKKIRILSSSVISPSMNAAIAEFSAKYANTKQVVYDVASYAGMIAANNESFGKAVVPSYNFNNANVIVSFGADFLGSWISPVEFSTQYVKNRKLRGKKSMSRHIQFETALSLTGSNADKRVPVKATEQSVAVLALYNALLKLAGSSPIENVNLDAKINESVVAAAKDLFASKGKALVVSSSNDTNVQLVVNAINSLLDSYGSTIDLDNVYNTRQGNDADVAALINEMKNGEVGALFIYNSNPVYTLTKSKEFAEALKIVGLKVSFADREDETAILADFVCPDNHYLESWSDAEPKKGMYSLGQPTIAPLFETRSVMESFLKWSGNDTDAHTYIANHWKANMFGKQKGVSLFESFWNTTLQNGVFETGAAASQSYKSTKDVSGAAKEIASIKTDSAEVVLYEKAGLGIGTGANNPWLQELPDPISKVCWDNYAAISAKYAKELGLEQGNVIEVKANGVTLELPVFIQPGQAYKTISVAIGYGRTRAGKAGNGVGVNVYPIATVDAKGMTHFYATNVSIQKTTKADYTLASTQTHHTMMGRAPVKETSLAMYINDPKSGNKTELFKTAFGKKTAEEVNFYEEHEKPNHHWGMAIDLNSCIGCGACVVSCQAENNVPVVGKDEISRSREMHWIRIDRYYTSDEDMKTEEEGKKDLHKLEIPSDNPQVVFQPVMCQHCNHAPCETVCPVSATTHSSEGINQMTYNRCVGTRYCANNCPYKVRRFNWFKYSDNSVFDFNMNDDLGKMVLNPDVVVRSRGVMEKCSMCVQRIQAGKLDAKKESRRPVDGEIKTACSQSCPTNAIIFGDFNDPKSEISEMIKDERSYHLLEELDVQPSVFYQTKVRNA
jgi:MoCo/4Fe-4S cofactor protein with predicted Tat translocation signal